MTEKLEFNPQALSRAKAYGLTQVVPSTGRELSRKLGVRKFTAKMLYQPEVNLKLGIYYLRMLLDQLGGECIAGCGEQKRRMLAQQLLPVSFRRRHIQF